jgi:hypothetical protein
MPQNAVFVVAGVQVRYWDRPFEFLSLGIMAYVGSDKALTQVTGEEAHWIACLIILE